MWVADVEAEPESLGEDILWREDFVWGEGFQSRDLIEDVDKLRGHRMQTFCFPSQVEGGEHDVLRMVGDDRVGEVEALDELDCC